MAMIGVVYFLTVTKDSTGIVRWELAWSKREEAESKAAALRQGGGNGGNRGGGGIGGEGGRSFTVMVLWCEWKNNEVTGRQRKKSVASCNGHFQERAEL